MTTDAPQLAILTRPETRAMWQPKTIQVAAKQRGQSILVRHDGLFYKGIFCFEEKDSIDYNFSLTHSNTGHRIYGVVGTENIALEIGRMIADLSDWSFTSLDGFSNIDPALPAKLEMLRGMFSNYLWRGENGQNQTLAVACAALNE